jgi:lipopolysaccharide/colanic/teichoic acid biosynthesis glycosyltransferase
MSKKVLHGEERTRLENELYGRYGAKRGFKSRWTYYRKKYSWFLVIGGAKFLKRALSLFVACFLLIFLFPAMLAIGIVIKLQNNGPIFYVSNRVGKFGQEFRFYKFRTMHMGADQLKENLVPYSDYKESITFKMKKDPRITSFGRFLRKTSLDELPQLWNVIKGDMALVGPRPHLPEEVSHYTLEQRRRLDIVPGITCIWQVSGRSALPFEQQVQLDLQYIESQNFWLDMKILLKTIPAVLFGRGAY